jgi:hypothetical protein
MSHFASTTSSTSQEIVSNVSSGGVKNRRISQETPVRKKSANRSLSAGGVNPNIVHFSFEKYKNIALNKIRYRLTYKESENHFPAFVIGYLEDKENLYCKGVDDQNQIKGYELSHYKCVSITYTILSGKIDMTVISPSLIPIEFPIYFILRDSGAQIWKIDIDQFVDIVEELMETAQENLKFS